MTIFTSARRYEIWLREQLDDVVEAHLAAKHAKMAKGPFEFLRATYWRWAETIDGVCRNAGIALENMPEALAVGDIHVENFGTWRDADGRLIWGVNDFDEAARMPYVLDIVRLAASAALARVPGMTEEAICRHVADGYEAGLTAPGPFVLDRDNKWLREKVIVCEDERGKFWKKFDPQSIARKKPEKVDPLAPDDVRRRYRKAIERAQPDGIEGLQYFSREAGTGSLGRARIFGVGRWQGDWVVREAKAMVRSGWTRAHGGAHRLRCVEIANGLHRSPDPTYHLRGHVLVRRLSPNDFKIEIEQPKGGKNGKKAEEEKVKELPRDELIDARMLAAMGQELGSIHGGAGDPAGIARDFKARRKAELLAAVRAVAADITREQQDWRDHPEKWPATKV